MSRPTVCTKPSGQAVVRIAGRDYYLGKHGAETSKEAYRRLITEWLTTNRQPSPKGERAAGDAPTTSELILAYWQWAEKYYRGSVKEMERIRLALRPLRQLYGSTLAAQFGPLELRSVRERMIHDGLARSTINVRIGVLKRLFKWAVGHAVVPPTVYQGLAAVEGLRRGRTDARETEPIKPVPEVFIDAVLPFAAAPVAAMIQLQRCTGMRPGEVVMMRSCDLDTTGAVWVFKPQTHKTSHHGHRRQIFLGPKAQQVIRPFLKPELTAYLFSPAEAWTGHLAVRRAKRITRLWPSHLRAQERKRRRCPQRKPGDRYDVASYRRAIARACRKAGVPAWHPHQLRHNAATHIRKEFGLDAARAVLGHRSAAITEIYAEVDGSRAAEVMARIG